MVQPLLAAYRVTKKTERKVIVRAFKNENKEGYKVEEKPTACETRLDKRLERETAAVLALRHDHIERIVNISTCETTWRQLDLWTMPNRQSKRA